MKDCPQCGFETPDEQWQEGYCVHCYADSQRALDEHNAQYGHWRGLSDEQRQGKINRSMRNW